MVGLVTGEPIGEYELEGVEAGYEYEDVAGALVFTGAL